MTLPQITEKLRMLKQEHRSTALVIKLAHNDERKRTAAYRAVEIEAEIAVLEKRACEMRGVA